MGILIIALFHFICFSRTNKISLSPAFAVIEVTNRVNNMLVSLLISSLNIVVIACYR